MLELDVRTSGEVRGLLKKDGIRAEKFAYIFGDFLRVKIENTQDRIWLTSFWAEKKEFMTGMYELDASAETERMSSADLGGLQSLQGSLVAEQDARDGWCLGS